MKTVLMFSPNDLDGVSLYRHWGPMLELEKKGHVKLVSMPHDVEKLTHWQYFRKCDLAFISRPAKKHDYFFIQECRKFGLPIWVDIDDNLFEVQDDNDAFEYYSGEEAQKFILFGLRSASVVSVATERLQKWMKKTLDLDAKLIPNALSDHLLSLRKPFKMSNLVVWRGSKSHLADLLYFENELCELIETFGGKNWLFMGMNPFFISRKIKNAPVRWSKLMNFVDYMAELSKNNAPFNFVSMIDHEFNRTRSCNGWMETTLTGSVTLAPDWEEWKRPGIFNYADKFSFVRRFKELVELSEHELSRMHFDSIQYVLDNYLLSKINDKRIKIINNL